MKFSRSICFASALVALLAASGCSDTSDLVDDGKAVSSVEITPDNDTLAKGSTIQLSAMVHYADGTSKDVTRDGDTVWNTSDTDVATVADGLVTAVSEGVVDISADYKGEKANEHFIVTP